MRTKKFTKRQTHGSKRNHGEEITLDIIISDDFSKPPNPPKPSPDP